MCIRDRATAQPGRDGLHSTHEACSRYTCTSTGRCSPVTASDGRRRTREQAAAAAAVERTSVCRPKHCMATRDCSKFSHRHHQHNHSLTDMRYDSSLSLPSCFSLTRFLTVARYVTLRHVTSREPAAREMRLQRARPSELCRLAGSAAVEAPLYHQSSHSWSSAASTMMPRCCCCCCCCCWLSSSSSSRQSTGAAARGVWSH